jgi:hypothetical protein
MVFVEELPLCWPVLWLCHYFEAHNYVPRLPFFTYWQWPLSVQLQRKLHPWMDDGTNLRVASPRRPKSFHIWIQGLLQFSSPKQFKTELGVASFLIPKKTVQNGIRGLLHFSSPKVFIYKMHVEPLTWFWFKITLTTFFHISLHIIINKLLLKKCHHYHY